MSDEKGLISRIFSILGTDSPKAISHVIKEDPSVVSAWKAGKSVPRISQLREIVKESCITWDELMEGLTPYDRESQRQEARSPAQRLVHEHLTQTMTWLEDVRQLVDRDELFAQQIRDELIPALRLVQRGSASPQETPKKPAAVAARPNKS